ncbi:DMT family transporter, partial [Deltaproteobacteria bacterium OttesenSCG-928-M10]|nr:DMT family transporter [Deltaproteobacteria bacterium OttesenSCG-928-M10]
CLAAFFWGTTFIFQRGAMDHLTPLAYGGIRFLLGGLALLPLVLPRARKIIHSADNPAGVRRMWLAGSLLSGGFIFAGVTLQQYGLVWTTAGKAAFITSLYVVLVPLILRFMGHKIVLGEGLGAFLAVVGLYLLSFTGLFSLSPGDGLVLVGAFVWAGHVLAVAWLAPRMDCLILGAGQALVCGLFSLAASLMLGQWPSWGGISGAWLDILWGSLFSVTLGFTLQVAGQKDANPTSAAVILQMEAVVAVLAGCLVLGEVMTGRMIAGSVLMLAGMLISQLWPVLARKKT